MSTIGLAYSWHARSDVVKLRTPAVCPVIGKTLQSLDGQADTWLAAYCTAQKATRQCKRQSDSARSTGK
jgi:hypothetical protein